VKLKDDVEAQNPLTATAETPISKAAGHRLGEKAFLEGSKLSVQFM